MLRGAPAGEQDTQRDCGADAGTLWEQPRPRAEDGLFQVVEGP